MKRLVATLAALALAMVGLGLLASPASATESGQYKTNHTVSVAAGETVTYIRSCNDSRSHPEGGTAVGGSAEFNETGSAEFLSVVGQGKTADGTGWSTTVHNAADRAYAYLSWATCDPVPAFESYETTVCWQMHGTANADGYSWPQTRLPSCSPTPKCDETIAIQKDVYLIENADEEAYLAGLQSMGSSADDQQIIKSWSLVTLSGDECAVVPPKPDKPDAKVETRHTQTDMNCDKGVVTVQKESRHEVFTLEDNEWVGSWSDWKPVGDVDTHEATTEQCPAVTPSADTPPAATPPVATPPVTAPHAVTPHAVAAPSVVNTPTVHTVIKPPSVATVTNEAPAAVKTRTFSEPPNTVTTTPTAGALPNTGGVSGWWTALAGLFLASGGGLMLLRRSPKRRT